MWSWSGCFFRCIVYYILHTHIYNIYNIKMKSVSENKQKWNTSSIGTTWTPCLCKCSYQMMEWGQRCDDVSTFSVWDSQLGDLKKQFPSNAEEMKNNHKCSQVDNTSLWTVHFHAIVLLSMNEWRRHRKRSSSQRWCVYLCECSQNTTDQYLFWRSLIYFFFFQWLSVQAPAHRWLWSRKVLSFAAFCRKFFRLILLIR